MSRIIIIDRSKSFNSHSFSAYFFFMYAQQNGITLESALALTSDTLRIDPKAIEIINLIGSYAASSRFSSLKLVEIDHKIDPYVRVDLSVDIGYNESESVTLKPNAFVDAISKVHYDQNMSDAQKLREIGMILDLSAKYNEKKLIKVSAPIGTLQIPADMRYCPSCKRPFLPPKATMRNNYECRTCNDERMGRNHHCHRFF